MLKIEDASYNYENSNNYALDSISIKLNKGEIVGLVGHNGAGKSTLFECISGLKTLTNGKVIVDNKDNNISFVPNDLFLYNMLTLRETLFFIGKLHSLTNSEIEQIIKPLIKLFSLRTKEHEYMKDLSFGMKQQVALIIGVLSNPTYILLDEPMTGYDAISTKNTKEYLKNLAEEKNIGIFLSSHRLDIIEDICDRIIILNTGKIIYEGTVSNLKNNTSFEKALISVTGDNNENN